MKLDGHIHLADGQIKTEDFIQRLREAGFNGGLIISKPPASFPELGERLPFSNRLDHLLELTGPYENLFPVFWVDPMESDAEQQINIAVERGVMGFKVICNNYYPSDKKAMAVFRAIAQKQKPLLFHSGILWDGRATSKYNKPAEFESLLEIDQLKFSLAHVSWPWYEELIAVYGKFQNAYSLRPDFSCEMFIDLTPGTPVIYRKEVLTKLLTVGYDVENNMVFGSDCYANEYNSQWANQWVNRDNDIYSELCLTKQIIAKIYAGNLKRFLGLTSHKIKKKSLKPGQ